MDSKKLNDWLQVAGLFGVLGGLVFVGLQLAFDRQVAIVQSTETAVNNNHYWAELVNNNRELWVKGLSGVPLTEAEKAGFDALAQARQLEYFSNYSRSVRGISQQRPERWIVEFAMELHGHPGFIRWFDELREKSRLRREQTGQPPRSNWNEAVTQELQRLEADESLK